MPRLRARLLAAVPLALRCALACGVLLGVSTAGAQRVPDPNEGDPELTQWGVLDGNRVRTLYANHGEISRYPDQPSGEWPKGSGHSYVDGIAFIVSAAARDAQGNVIYPMSTNYREFIDRDPVTQVPWGWAPVPGYSNFRQASPARSDDENTWPPEWPDRPIDWAGQWNGYFGRGVRNADVETYFVMDDAHDPEWTLPPHQFFPCPGQDSRGGLGLEVAVRGFQWSHPLAQDVIFWVYEITNECGQDYDDIVFAQYIDWGVGGTDDSGDDEGAYNTRLDLAFAWDADGVGSPGQWGPVGTAGYAFLESPGNAVDAIDNDEDGITNERRDSGTGALIEGADAILAYVTANYDVADFEAFYGTEIEETAAYLAGRWFVGDENMNWQQFTDVNGSGQWDSGEPLLDDVGEDGIGPEAENYPGRDVGEGDGRPTSGEPNFDGLDKDESDQIGLTGFSVFDVHNYELLDDQQNYNIFREALPPIDVILEGGRNLGMFFASGPFPLRAGQTERFSMALLFADKDFTDPRQIENSALARKKQTVQQIYNANYRFARPPDKPTLTATPGDGMVTLTWDTRSERSYDPFLREFDFEGYMIYRSTEPNFRERLLITDAYGNPVYQQPLAQYDLVNGLRGLHPVSVNGVQFNLGNDTGLRHTFIDHDVVNGQTYYYALVAYDRGLVNRNPDGSLPTAPDGTIDGLSPSITTAVINNDIAGNTVPDINTAVVTPRAPAAGYVAPEVASYAAALRGTGPVDLAIVAAGALNADRRYELLFENPSVWDTTLTPAYRLVETTSGEVLESGNIRTGLNELPLTEGFAITLEAPAEITVPEDSVRFTAGDGGTLVPVVLPGSSSPVVAPARHVRFPYDFEVRFADTFVDTSRVLAFGQFAIPLPFQVWNTTLDRVQDVIIVEDVPETRNRMWDPGELVIFVDGETPGATPQQAGGRWRGGWALRFTPPDPGVEPDPPHAGSVLRITTTKPYATGDRIAFSFTAPGFDAARAADELADVFVVPNPYVAQSTFEPANPFITGRGERRIYFMNLPPQCTIRIYTITGELVQTLTHDSTVDDGQEPWDLTSRDGMDVAFGVYLFHVDAPGVGETVGRFALIK